MQAHSIISQPWRLLSASQGQGHNVFCDSGVLCIPSPVLGRHVLEGHSSWVSDAALTANGALGVTCSGDELAVAWDLRDGSFLRILDGHCAEIRAAVLTERGR